MQFDLSTFKQFQAGQNQQPANQPKGEAHSILCRNRRTDGFVFVRLDGEHAPEFGNLVAVKSERGFRVEIYDGQPFVGVIVPAIEPMMSNDNGLEDSFPRWL